MLSLRRLLYSAPSEADLTFTPGAPTAAMRECLKRHRTLLVRGAIDREPLANMLSRAQEAYAHWDWMMERHKVSPRIADQCIGSVASGHVPTTDVDPQDHSIFEDIANTGFVRKLVDDLFCYPHRIVMPYEFQVRRMLPPSLGVSHVMPKVAWHQDEYLSIATGAVDPCLAAIMWAPLVDCGRDAPGLSVVVGSDAPIVMGDPKRGWDRYIADTYGPDRIWSPEMTPGDVLVFTSRTIHGSHITADMARPRINIEMRCGIYW